MESLDKRIAKYIKKVDEFMKLIFDKCDKKLLINIDKKPISMIEHCAQYEKFINENSYGYVLNGKDGMWIYWYSDGTQWEEGFYKNGIKHGIWKQWHKNGNRFTEGEYVNGEAVGKWSEWHENGSMAEEGYYQNDYKVGKWTYWDEKGYSDKDI